MVPGLDGEGRAVSSGVSNSSIFPWSFPCCNCERKIGDCGLRPCVDQRALFFITVACIAESLVQLF